MIRALKLVIPLRSRQLPAKLNPYQVTTMSAPRAPSLPLLSVQTSGPHLLFLPDLVLCQIHIEAENIKPKIEKLLSAAA